MLLHYVDAYYKTRVYYLHRNGMIREIYRTRGFYAVYNPSKSSCGFFYFGFVLIAVRNIDETIRFSSIHITQVIIGVNSLKWFF